MSPKNILQLNHLDAANLWVQPPQPSNPPTCNPQTPQTLAAWVYRFIHMTWQLRNLGYMNNVMLGNTSGTLKKIKGQLSHVHIKKPSKKLTAVSCLSASLQPSFLRETREHDKRLSRGGWGNKRIMMDVSWYFNQQRYQRTTRKHRQNATWQIFIWELGM